MSHSITLGIFVLYCLLTCSCVKQLFSEITDSYIPTEIPSYLDSPIIYTGTLNMCGLVSGSSSTADSYCSDATLSEIKLIMEWYVGNLTENLNSTISTLRDAFDGVGQLLWRRFDEDSTTLEGTKATLEKILLDYRRQQVALGLEMENCLNTVSQLLGGYLCAGCNITKNPLVLRPSLRPIIHVKSSTVDIMQKNCSRFVDMVSKSIDSYHRTKMIITDLLTSQLGTQNHVCTCSGEAVNETYLLSYNVTGLERDLAENEYTITSATWDAFSKENFYMVDSGVTTTATSLTPETEEPYFVQNSSPILDDSDAEGFANSTLKSSGIHMVKGGKLKTYKREYFSDFTSLCFALSRIFNRTIEKRTYTSLYRELDEFTDISSFSYDEVRNMAVSLIKSYVDVVDTPAKTALLFRLFVKLFIDFLFRPPPSVKYSGFSAPDSTPIVMASYSAALLRIMKNYYYTSDYLYCGPSGTNCQLPFINVATTALGTYTCGKETITLDKLVECEKNITSIYSSSIVMLPIFRMINRVEKNLTEYKENLTDFLTQYEDVALLDQDFRSYIMLYYMPPYFYIINPDERSTVTDSQKAKAAYSFYTNCILRYPQEILEDCMGYIKAFKHNLGLLKAIVRTEKDVGRSDQQLRKYVNVLSSDEYKKLLTYEMNKRAVSYAKRCTSTETCKIGYVDDEQNSTVEVELAVKTVLEPDYALIEERVYKGHLGMTSISELNPYNDEENIALAKCDSPFSARTLLCIQGVENDILGLLTLINPPDYSDLSGTGLATLLFTKHKLQSLLQFASTEQSDPTISSGTGGVPNDPIVVVDNDYGMDLLASTGFTVTLNSSELYLSYDLPYILPYGSSSLTSGAIMITCGSFVVLATMILLIQY